MTYPDGHVRNHADKRNGLLLYARGHKVQLVEVRVADVRANVPFLLLFLFEAFLALTGSGREQIIANFPSQQIFERPNFWCLLCFNVGLFGTYPFLKDFLGFLLNLLSRTKQRRVVEGFRVTLDNER